MKSLLPVITEDVAKGGVITEDQVISRAQYLDLVYTQSGTLYEKILNLPHPISDPIVTSPIRSNVVDGIIGSVS